MLAESCHKRSPEENLDAPKDRTCNRDNVEMEEPSMRDSQIREITERPIKPSPTRPIILSYAVIRSCPGVCVVRCCTRAVGQKSFSKIWKVVQDYDLVGESGISGAITRVGSASTVEEARMK